ncbi:MAG: hypothetical protein KKG33_11230 [candidate division Zixibacteria bacterium]|nr:hypothetical protein [candidate division Zixibacteria bacterium]MBU1471917.1 hypothetical protein [candidate division Zixibacteria bacterium]MBU2626120.1 hypothetical protein [candidate division Zixibacteria bacterium]
MPNLIYVAAGAIVGFIATYLQERRKEKNATKQQEKLDHAWLELIRSDIQQTSELLGVCRNTSAF